MRAALRASLAVAKSAREMPESISSEGSIMEPAPFLPRLSGIAGSGALSPLGVCSPHRSHRKVLAVSRVCVCSAAHARWIEVGQRTQLIIAWPYEEDSGSLHTTHQ